ncbi:carboxypeptidase-like regulatory domain-containing protein [Conexibacter sp. JD483]|uniref:carboxypeptidase-like regulatory domain-containing protein n=1 Tax=unclassified Conexibacter TaxID=2627773 RepID=UPI00271F60E9|nr:MULTISPECIES: carboxypeptidase-like regulatory domain-containing protein [unclassified Conexibacter]MDO8187271.1 carboxypeptidase-like regulatory domain-containing protein [Conexibacter sp. CPCC 205706]MDO8198880.1 carboxypeptidase-like regulatory domain-containing protein [Conexibacter sp. CPCC 205762]MDR9370619.1 carboxypeptidase-like regulatory domain-containing protein [Conexibacter sp. JD483]
MTAAARLRALVCALIAAAALALAASPAYAGDWTVAEITGPPGTRWIQPTAVNINGVVVGRAYFPGRGDMTPFRWENGTMVELATTEGIAYDVNDSGVIVGRLGDNGAVWTGSPPALGLTARNIAGRYGSAAHGINARGTIAGSAGDAGNIPPPWNNGRSTYDNRFPALTTGGGWSRLPMPDVITDRGATIIGGDAMKVNDNGLILIGGMNMSGRPRLSSGGVAGPIFDMVAGNQGFNNSGQIAGRTLFSSPTTDPFSARVWDGTQYVDVGAGQPRSRANAINDNGWIVGRAGTEDYQAEYRQLGNAWLWRLDEAPVPLAQLGPAGWSYANATDVNNDGVIVGVGQHGGVEMGFMMTPAAIAHRLSGTVWDANGGPVAGAQLRIVGAAGQEITPAVTTGADGRYSTTLLRGDYLVTVLPAGRYVPDAGAGCALLGATCGLGLSRNRVVDFYAIPSIPPPPLPPGRDSGRSGSADRTGPAIRGPKAGTTVALSRRGAVGIGLGPFAEPVSGTVVLREAAARRGRARRRALAAAKQPAPLGRASFKARASRRVVVTIRLSRAAKRRVKQRRRLAAVVVVTARDAAGNATTKSFSVTLKG